MSERNLRLLRVFKKTNGLIRDADYPESQIFQWAVIIALLVTESILNSYFFAQGSDLGLLGGFLQAFLISIANIGSALLMGAYILPWKNHIQTDENDNPLEKWSMQKSIAVIAIPFYCILIFTFNLAVAHYRAQLEIQPIKAVINAMTTMAASPFGIGNFEAWVLCLMGLLFSSFALIKGYTSDDSYPGYGKMTRAYLIEEGNKAGQPQ